MRAARGNGETMAVGGAADHTCKGTETEQKEKGTGICFIG